MGLNIKEIVPRRELDLSELKGKILCVDAYNMIYQFLTTIRQPDGTPLMDTKRRITSHLSGIFYRNANLILEGVRLIYVFDGEPPYLKSQTLKIRDEIRYTNKEKYALAQELGDTEKMRRYSANLIRLDEDMIKESKELLEAMGIQTVQAPSEGEAEAAYLTKINSKIYATVSQDYDSLLFGAPRLIRNLGLSRKRKTLSGWV
ncbi:MAG: flap structure-specific endonuclease, partial [Candidatus Pacearchaeota archaeon]